VFQSNLHATSIQNKDKILDQSFFLDSEGMKCWQVCQALSDYYDVNILVFDDIKEKPIFGQVKGVSVTDCLDVISWLIGVEWIKENNIYFIGGNRKNVSVLDSFGLPDNINTIFKEVSIIGDKVVVTGSERDVKRIVDALKELSDKEYIKVWLVVFEVGYDSRLKFGIDWEYFIKYSFSWQHLIQGQFNPIQTMAVSFLASAKAEEKYWNIDTKINTCIGVLSGSESVISAVEDIDREVYNQSQFGEQVISGFNTQTTGLKVKVKGYKTKFDNWLFDIHIENSRAESSTSRKVVDFSNKVILPSGGSSIIGIINEESHSFGYDKGFPYISRIPYIGALFSIHQIINLDKKIVAMIFLEPKYKSSSNIIDKVYLSCGESNF